MSTHRVILTFDDGVYAKLVCPDTGCQTGDTCGACGRSIHDDEITPCYDCPTSETECWVKSWFDNLTADELLHGTLTVEIDARWDSDHMVADIVRAVESTEP